MPDAHRRLDDAHEYWHESRDNYMDPHNFRRSFNAFLQALRSTVFLIERRKRSVPNGEENLRLWRGSAKEEPFYKWGMNSRDRVVHEADLALLSEAVITYSRVGVNYTIDRFNVTPNVSNDLLLSAMLTAKPDSVRNGLLTVTRRWVAEDLPDFELLAVGGELFSAIAALVRSFGGDGCDLDLPDRTCLADGVFDRPHCMATLKRDTRITIDVSTRQKLVADVRRFALDSDFDPKVAEERYGDFITPSGDPMHSAMTFMRRARLFLTVDSEALPFINLYRGDKIVEVMQLGLGDKSEQIAMFNHLAERVKLTGADGFVFIGEVWTSWRARPQVMHEHDFTYYDLKPNRNEALSVFAAMKDGRSVQFLQPFQRDAKGWPELEGTVRRAFGVPREFQPLVHVWH